MVRIWPAGDPPGVITFHGSQGDLLSAVVSPDGSQLLTASNEFVNTTICDSRFTGACGWMRLWPITGGDPSVLGAPGGQAVFSPDGRRVAQGDISWIHIWPIDGGQPVDIDRRETVWSPPAFSPDGAIVAAAAVFRADGSGRVANVEMGPRVGRATSVAFSPDGSRMVATAFSAPALIWRTADWAAEPVAITGSAVGFFKAVFDPVLRQEASGR
jgi:WD40 repeat protein